MQHLEKTEIRQILTAIQIRFLRFLAHQFPLNHVLFDDRNRDEYMVDFAYTCAKLEGNGYDRVDADCLLRMGITRGDNLFTDANELVALKKIFNLIIQEGSNSPLNLDFVLRFKKKLEPGTQDEIDDQAEIQRLLDDSSQYEDQFEKAIFLHCNFAARQFFGNSNMQMARMIQTASMVQSGVMPLFFQESLFEEYKIATDSFCTAGDYVPYADFFVKSYLAVVLDHLGISQLDLREGSGSFES